MKKFNTLDELFSAAEGHQVTGQEILNCSTYVLGQWQDIELSEELKTEVINQISELFGGREKTKMYIRMNLRSSKPQHWGLSRIVIEKYNNPAKLCYITGQDFISESKMIRTFLVK